MGTRLLCIKDGRRSRTLQNGTKDQDQTDGILPASMSSLPILHFLLLLLRLQVPQAQGFPTLRPDQYSVIVTEILRALNESPLASQVSSWDKYGQGGCCQPTGLTQRAVSLSAPTEPLELE